MRKDDLTGLAVVRSSARKITADCRANYCRRLEMASRAPAGHNQFVANLHHRGPDIIEELHFSDRLHAADSHANRAAGNGSLRERRIKDAIRSETPLQPGGRFEDTPFALDLLQILFAAAIGHVFAEHYDSGIPLHFVGKR